jgi:hypothetical protein
MLKGTKRGQATTFLEGRMNNIRMFSGLACLR